MTEMSATQRQPSRRLGIPPSSAEDVEAILAARNETAARVAENATREDFTRQEPMYETHFPCSVRAPSVEDAKADQEATVPLTSHKNAAQTSELEARTVLFDNLLFLFRVCSLTQRVSERLQVAKAARRSRAAAPLPAALARSDATGRGADHAARFCSTLPCSVLFSADDHAALPTCGKLEEAAAAASDSRHDAGLFFNFHLHKRNADRHAFWSQVMHLTEAQFPLFALNMEAEAAQELAVYGGRRARADSSSPAAALSPQSATRNTDISNVVAAAVQPAVTLEQYVSEVVAAAPTTTPSVAARGPETFGVPTLFPVATLEDARQPVQSTFGLQTSACAAAEGRGSAGETYYPVTVRRTPSGLGFERSGRPVSLLRREAIPRAMQRASAADVDSNESDSDPDYEESSPSPTERAKGKARASASHVDVYRPQWARLTPTEGEEDCNDDELAHVDNSRSQLNSVDRMEKFILKFAL